MGNSRIPRGCAASRKMDVDACLETCMKGELLSEEEIKEICSRVKELLVYESNVVHIKAPCAVVGDIHGQFYDLLEIFRISGPPPNVNYLFLGDFVDRGYHSVETITLLSVLKLRYPNRITLLRGNHESRQITQVYGFFTECQRKYGSANVWRYFTDMFDYLTLAAVIDNGIFAIHGGLSPLIVSLDQIRVLDRFQEIPHEGPLTDLLWSDPDPDKPGWNASQRGAGYLFGSTVVKKFLSTNNFEHITRAHQLCMDGYQVLFDDQLSTVWSAPNYCYRCGNIASVMEVSDTLDRNFNTFDASPDNEKAKPEPDELKEVPDYFI